MWEFLSGWFVGFTCCILFGFFLLARVDIFCSLFNIAPYPDVATTHHKITSKLKKLKRRLRQVRQAPIRPTDEPSIQDYLYTALSSQSTPEAYIGANAVFQRVFHYLSSVVASGVVDAEKFLNQKLKEVKKPIFLGDIIVTDMNMGEVLPLITHMRVLSYEPTEPLEFDFWVIYTGESHLCMVMELCLSYPVSRLAVLPIEVAISEVQFDAQIRCRLQDGRLDISFVEAPNFSFELSTEIGYLTTLKDLPHLKVALHSVLCTVFESLIYPKFHSISLNPATPQHTLPSHSSTNLHSAHPHSSSASRESGETSADHKASKDGPGHERVRERKARSVRRKKREKMPV